MKTHPIETREALAKLHKSTQRFWTWLTALTHRNEPPREPWTAAQHYAAFLSVAVVAFSMAAWSSQHLYTLALLA